MQNRYVGDVGDFGKYGLLRRLCMPKEGVEGTGLRLGVAWYLVPDEVHNADGKIVGYLNPTRTNLRNYRTCDPKLYDALATIIRDQDRSVFRVQTDGILPANTYFYSEILSFAGMPSIGQAVKTRCLGHRQDWLNGALDATRDSEIVFLGPDNGLEIRSMARHRNKGPKHAFYDEISPFIQRGQSVIVIHHICHRDIVEEIHARLDQLHQFISDYDQPFALSYHRGTSPAFFILPNKAHRDILVQRVKNMLDGPWAKHFELIEPAVAL